MSWQDEITDRSLHEECQRIAADCLQEAREYDREPSDCLWETIDGHRWVIYTGAAQQLLAISHYDDYAIEELGITGLAEGGGIDWSALAFGALYGQASEALCQLTEDDEEADND